ncbi:MAG: D-glycerate dehydrogenase [Planctomycetia bacterium]|nr:D-glycerate dehydrogenase [Planctomycetia bacterium]
MSSAGLPRVMADGPLAPIILEMLAGEVEWMPWLADDTVVRHDIAAVYTYGHPRVDGALLDRFPNARVVSNYGVGVDHIDLRAAAERKIPVGNTPGILDGATADMGFALLLAAARRIVVGDRYARSAEFTRYDPGYMLGREVHSSTLGIVGMGRIGAQVAQRARGFDMQVQYHNRTRRPDVETALGVQYATLDRLLATSDYVMLCCPLTAETRGLMNRSTFAQMKPTAMLINIARGPVVDTDALTEALTENRIAGAGLDVTDPEPLPRGHPLLALDNVTIVPHLGSATLETRRRMAELSVDNLRAGLAGKPLVHEVRA